MLCRDTCRHARSSLAATFAIPATAQLKLLWLEASLESDHIVDRMFPIRGDARVFGGARAVNLLVSRRFVEDVTAGHEERNPWVHAILEIDVKRPPRGLVAIGAGREVRAGDD